MNTRFFELKRNIFIKDVLQHLNVSHESFYKVNSKVDVKINEIKIKDFCSFNFLSENKLTFLLQKPKELNSLLNGICLMKKEDISDLPVNLIKIPISNPKNAFSRLIEVFCKKKIDDNSTLIHKNYSLVSSSAKIGKNVKIGPFSVIKNNVVIGDNVSIDERVTISENCVIGNNSVIKSGVYIECSILKENVTINQNSVIGKDGFGFDLVKENTKIFNHVGGVLISQNSNIGSNCNIDRGFLEDTFLGKSVMIDNQVHVAHNCKIGNYCVLAGKSALSGSVVLEDEVILGGDVGIVDNIVIGEKSIISAASKVFKNFPKNSKIGGYPAQNLYDWQRIQVHNNRNLRKHKNE